MKNLDFILVSQIFKYLDKEGITIWIRDTAFAIGLALGIVHFTFVFWNYLYQAICIFIMFITMTYYIRDLYLQMGKRKDYTINPSWISELDWFRIKMGQVCLAPLASIVNLVANYNITNGYLAGAIISIYLITMIFINSKIFETSYFYGRNIIEIIFKSIFEWDINYQTSKDQTENINNQSNLNNSLNYKYYNLYQKTHTFKMGMRKMSTYNNTNKNTGDSNKNEIDKIDGDKDKDNKDNNVIHLDNNNNYINNQVKEILSHTENKFKSKYSGGFKSYKVRDINILKGFSFEYNTELSKYNIDRNSLRQALQNYLNILEENKVYSILFIATGITVNNSIMNNNVISDSSMLVTKDFPINSLVNIVYLFIDKYLSHYLPSHFNESGIYSLIVKEKVWIDDNVYGKDKFYTIKNKIITSANKEFKKVEKTIDLIDKFKNLKVCGMDLKYNIIIEKSLYLNNNINISIEEFIDSLHKEQIYKVDYQNEGFTFKFSCISDKDNVIIRKADVYSYTGRLLLSWVDVIKLSYNWNKFKKLEKWLKMSCEFNNLQVIERTIGSIKYSWSENKLMIEDYIKNKIISIKNIDVDIDDTYRLNRIIQTNEDINIYENYRVNYNLNFVEELTGDNIFDGKIGAYDFETKTNDKGLQEVYSGCWRAGDHIETYFIGDNGIETSDKLINQMFKDMFLKGYEGYKFYAHNGKNFDSHFIPAALLRNKDSWNDLDIKMVKDENNANIEVKIFSSKIDGKGNKKKVCIFLWDSLSILPLSLNKIGEVFNLVSMKESKMIYPYEFVNKYGIDYKGKVPTINWFVNASSEQYKELINEYKDREWSVKEYAKLYVTRDVNVLYNCLINFGKKVYNEFGVNITKRKTISGLTMLVYQSSFLNINRDKIAILPKNIDNIIRKSYTGGQVQGKEDTFLQVIEFQILQREREVIMLKIRGKDI